LTKKVAGFCALVGETADNKCNVLEGDRPRNLPSTGSSWNHAIVNPREKRTGTAAIEHEADSRVSRQANPLDQKTKAEKALNSCPRWEPADQLLRALKKAVKPQSWDDSLPMSLAT
jgi:hypothetical protein